MANPKKVLTVQDFTTDVVDYKHEAIRGTYSIGKRYH